LDFDTITKSTTSVAADLAIQVLQLFKVLVEVT